jgi:hypothetical protein
VEVEGSGSQRLAAFWEIGVQLITRIGYLLLANIRKSNGNNNVVCGGTHIHYYRFFPAAGMSSTLGVLANQKTAIRAPVTSV